MFTFDGFLTFVGEKKRKEKSRSGPKNTMPCFGKYFEKLIDETRCGSLVLSSTDIF